MHEGDGRGDDRLVAAGRDRAPRLGAELGVAAVQGAPQPGALLGEHADEQGALGRQRAREGDRVATAVAAVDADDDGPVHQRDAPAWARRAARAVRRRSPSAVSIPRRITSRSGAPCRGRR